MMHGDYSYRPDADGNACLTGYVGTASALSVPSELDGHPVTAIGPEAFAGCEHLTRVILQPGVRCIRKAAFSCCSRLQDVILPESITHIAQKAFFKCASLTRIVIPDRVASIAKQTFLGCTSLVEIRLPFYLRTIGKQAFRNCRALSRLTGFKVSPDTIGREAFLNCRALTHFDFSGKTEKVGQDAFRNCSCDPFHRIVPDDPASVERALYPSPVVRSITLSSGVTRDYKMDFRFWTQLTAIHVAEDHPDFASVDGLLYDQSCSTLISCPPGRTGSLSLPDGVTTIRRDAFINCDGLTSISLPDSVTTIDSLAFSCCFALTDIRLAASVQSIAKDAFFCCPRLTLHVSPDSAGERH